jgi:peptidoglycan/xylan/chitin deacetylase (PgdA/CDA1 family)
MMAVPVLLYHGVGDEASPEVDRFTVSPRVFEQHMRHLAGEGYRSLTVSEFLPVLAGGGDGLPPRPVLITFDDGFRNFLTEALPIMERYRLSSTLYATTGFLGDDRPGTNASGDEMLSWSELAEVSRRGVEVGGHTHSHPMLDTLPQHAACLEISRCKDLIEQRLQEPIRSFAYPHGYSSVRVRRSVREAGYSSACAVKNALSHTGDDPFAIARLMIEKRHTMADLTGMLSGQGVRLAASRDQLRTRGWRLARRSLAAGRRLAGRS